MTARTFRRAACAALLACAIGPWPSATSAADAKPAPCTSPQHRQFDFWLGAWDVEDPAGKAVGRNRITSVHGGCALLEEWQGRGGFSGTSLNAYDAATQRWHQTWVDNSGGLLRLEGAFGHGAMRLEGASVETGPPAVTTQQRIEWTLLPDGRVRQHWQASRDGGSTWTTVFDGRYRKAP